MQDNYDARCVEASVSQGLGPAALALANAGIPFSVDQTGGFTMCLHIKPEADNEFRWIWVSNDSSPGEPDEYIVGLYDGLDASEGQEAVSDTRVPLGELAEMVRVYRGANFKRNWSLQVIANLMDRNQDMLKDAINRAPDPSWDAFRDQKLAEYGALVRVLKEAIDAAA